MKLVLTKICFILQNIVSAFLCFSCMWLIAYIPMFPIVIENSIAEIKNQPFAIFSFLASLIVGGLLVIFPVTYFITLYITWKNKKITRLSFIPTEQILICVVLYMFAFYLR